MQRQEALSNARKVEDPPEDEIPRPELLPQMEPQVKHNRNDQEMTESGEGER